MENSVTIICNDMLFIPTLQDIQQAHERIKPYIHNTPLLTSETLNSLTGVSLWIKPENFQKIGAFKARGACNAVRSLSPEQAVRGVATHSSGNHAAALALAAKTRGIPAYIVMPHNAPEVKKRSVERYGGIITYCEATLESRESTLLTVLEATGAIEIHPFNNALVIAGQATATLEILKANPSITTIVAPVGGGGLLSGTALAAAYTAPNVRVIGAEPELAGDAALSLQNNAIQPAFPPHTIADGLRTSLSELTFSIIQDHVSEIITVPEERIIQTMKQCWEVLKIIIEPSGAVPLAVIMEQPQRFAGQNVAVIISGGNVDLECLPW